jgi:phage shock protein A
MSILENRLHLRRHQYEARRRSLEEFASLAQRLRADGRRLQADIEEAVAVGNPDCAGKLLERHGKLARSLATIEGQIAAAGEALASAARELQRHELAWAKHSSGAGVADRRRVPRSPRAQPAAPDRSD